MNTDKIVKDLIFSHYNRMLKEFKLTCRRYGVVRMPIRLTHEIINKSRLKPDQKTDFGDFFEKFNSVIDALIKSVSIASETIGDNAISQFEFEEIIKACKKSFIQGQKQRK